jgi:hypothetical protein
MNIAMRRAKGVVHINVAKFGERTGEFGIVGFFLGLKPKVLQQRDVAILHMSDNFFRNLAYRIVAEEDRLIDQRMQIIADRSKRIFGHRLALRSAEVRHQNRFRFLLAEIIDRRQRLANSSVVGDFNFVAVLLNRDVEIDAHQDAFPANIDIWQRQLRHYFASISIISTQRLL